MQTSQIQTVHHDSGFSRRLARPLTAGLMVCIGMAASLANAQPEASYRWWNPNGAPESGSMNDSSNWENFVFPSPHPSAKNHLLFKFAQSGDCVANNNLLDFLSVASINRMNSADGTVRITGSTLRLRAGTGYEKCYIFSKPSYPLILETPLAGTTGLEVVNGDVELRPSVRGLHTITGGFKCNLYTVLAVSESWHLGAISNWVTVGEGTLRFDAPMTVGITVSASENGTLHTNTSGTVQLLKFNTRGVTRKTGPGTLRVFGAGPDNQDQWYISQGTLVAESGSVDSSRVSVASGATLQFAAPASLEAVTGSGVIDIDDHTVEASYAYIEGSAKLMGNGLLRAVGPTSSVSIETDDLINDFTGVIEADGGQVSFFQSSIDSPMTLRPVHPSDLIEFFYSGNYRVGLLEGAGVINMRSIFSELEFGVGGDDGTFSGTIQSPLLITKVGSGRQDFTGTLDLGGREIVISDGVVGLSDSAAGGVSKIVVQSDGTFTPIGTVNAPTVEGAGTVQLNSQTLTVGETNLDFALSGTLNGNIETSTLRKLGSGTFTLSADTTGFGGFFQINDGAVRFTGGPILPAAASLNISNGALRGFGDLARPYWNQGTITADSSAGVLRLSGQDHWNNGTINAENGGSLELDGVFLEQDFSGSLVQGSLESNDTPIRLIGDNPTIVQGGTIETTGTGSLELIGTAITLREVDHSGHLSLRSGVDVTAEDFGIVTGASHIFSIEFEPDSDEDDGAIRGHGTATLGGTLQVTLPNGYEPTAGDVMTVLGGDDTGVWVISESFETIDVPDVSPLLMRVESDSDSLRLVVTCGVDMAEPFGSLDIFDVFAYLDAFNAGDLVADYTGDGTLDIFDVFAFLEEFNAGCP